jgi:hypothetical protein
MESSSKANSKAAYELRELCERLVCQPSRMTSVAVTAWCRNFGYGRDLGLALLQNSSVTSLYLCMAGLLDPLVEDTSNDACPLLDYLVTSKALTTVGFFGGDDHDVLVDRFIDSAAQNSNIVEVVANESIRPEALTHFLMTSPSIQKMRVRLGQFGSSNRGEMLAQAFGTNQTLQELRLSALKSEDIGIIELILSKLGSNSSKLCVLHLEPDRAKTLVQVHGLVRLLSTTRTLCHIGFWGAVFETESMDALLTALQSNQTVRCLTFGNCIMKSNTTADLFGAFLRSNSSLIRELHLEPVRCNV